MSSDFTLNENPSEAEETGQDHMIIQEDKSLIDYLVTLIAIGMSVWHIHLAFTGGYESTFQRSVTYLFGMPLIFLVFRDRTETGLRLVYSLLLFALAASCFAYVIINIDYHMNWIAKKY